MGSECVPYTRSSVVCFACVCDDSSAAVKAEVKADTCVRPQANSRAVLARHLLPDCDVSL